MECALCKVSYPYIQTDGEELACIYCEGRVRPDASDYLSRKDLGLVNEVRPNQVKLTGAVTQALKTNTHLVCEAGTGIGKSFSYLLPAILSNKRVVISTAKKSLQSQLIEKDLPYLRNKLKIGFKFQAAYGKSNYACEKRILKYVKNPSASKAYNDFLRKSLFGLWEDATNPKVEPSSGLSAEHCIGSKCPLYKTCGYIKARKDIQESHVVVTNHWLLGLDLRLKREGIDYLFPYDAVIVDEAHKFDEGIRAAYTHSISESTVPKIIHQYDQDAQSPKSLLTAFPNSKNLLKEWKSLFAHLPKEEGAITGLPSQANTLVSLGHSIIRQLDRYSSSPNSRSLHDTVTVNTAREDLEEVVETLSHALVQGITSGNDYNHNNRVVYLEHQASGRVLNVAPVDVGKILSGIYDQYPITWIYLSATLKVNNSLDTFINKVGIKHHPPIKGSFDSPFDYGKQAILYTSKSVPAPTRSIARVTEYRDSLSSEILDLIEANRGNALVLFTARDEMEHAYEYLSCRTNLPLILQIKGASASSILSRYRNTPDAVLLGLKSFWEGIDIQGDKLNLVIVSKLPFPSKSDPIMEARRKAAGDKWFPLVDLPEMILDLRQGVGRLIRTQTDKGVIAILDSRLLTKRYTSKVLSSLNLPKITNSKVAITNLLERMAEKRQ